MTKHLRGQERALFAASAATMYQSGKSLTQVAASIDRSICCARSLIREGGGIIRGGGHQPRSPERGKLAAQVVEEYLAGATMMQIAADIDRSYTLVRTLLLEEGVALRPRGTRSTR
ncbi:helix-turn-helix domain-containing protein [Streptomyces olivoreticuli]